MKESEMSALDTFDEHGAVKGCTCDACMATRGARNFYTLRPTMSKVLLDGIEFNALVTVTHTDEDTGPYGYEVDIDSRERVLPSCANTDIAEAFTTLKAAMAADNGYAWSWHCNVAMAGFDAGCDHELANQGAARFMQAAFDIDVRQFPEWITLEAKWAESKRFAQIPRDQGIKPALDGLYLTEGKAPS